LSTPCSISPRPVASGGNLPKDFPPHSTVQGHFYQWAGSGLWRRINHVLVMTARERLGREASPSAGLIDSQTLKSLIAQVRLLTRRLARNAA
jgi:transposase